MTEPFETIEVLQVPVEFDPLRELYRETNPERVLEIGCWEGGTMREWLTEGEPALVVAVDLEHRNPAGYEAWRKPGTELVVVTGSSQSGPVIEEIERHAPYDWVFIDGDHGDECVRSDVNVTLPLVREGGHLILHDIDHGTVDSGSRGPRIMFEELAARYETAEHVDPTPQPWAHGIGVVRVSET